MIQHTWPLLRATAHLGTLQGTPAPKTGTRNVAPLALSVCDTIIAHFTEAIRLDPKGADNYFWRGEFYAAHPSQPGNWRVENGILRGSGEQQ
jgi:hypothetical protein